MEGTEQISRAAVIKDSIILAPDQDGRAELVLGQGEQLREWEAFPCLTLRLRARMDAMAVTEIQFWKEENEKPSNILTYQIIPGLEVTVRIQFHDLKSDRLYIETTPGMLKGKCKGLAAGLEEMEKVSLVIYSPYCSEFQDVELLEAYLTDQPPVPAVNGEPMVDEFGQWIGKDWPGKTKTEQELTDYLRQELQRAEGEKGFPPGLSRYGGFLQKRFEQTGFFRLQKAEGRHWLVDPEGYAFFSNGVCYGCRMGVHGFVDGMETLFSWLPEEGDGTYRDAWTTADQIPEYAKRNGPGAGKRRKMFNFARANMIRAFGPEGWWEAWNTINVARLKRWGFNTIGVGVNNYYDERVTEYLARGEIPFVWTLKHFPLTRERIFRDFPDVYAGEYRENAKSYAAEQLAPHAGNPWMIGYFITNEPEWRFQNVNLAEQTFAREELLESKSELIRLLQEKYGEIRNLNRVWNTAFADFAELRRPMRSLADRYPGAGQDLEELHKTLVRQYERVVREELRRVDPDHLNLGMRYAYGGKGVMGGCGEQDVFSFNCYEISPQAQLDACRAEADMPLFIGEWHVGGAGQGKLSAGLLYAPDQEERGKAMAYYLQRALAHPNCIGANYFEMNDEPLLGRFDGECMAHGLIDVCNRPYERAVEHMIRTARKMYEYRTGQEQPAEELPRVVDVLHKIKTF